MPFPNFASLQASPDSLLNWLQTNLLVADGILNVANPPGTSDVTFINPVVPYPGATVENAVDASGSPIGVYKITNNPALLPGNAFNPATSLASYICNYTANGRNGVNLGSLGDYCFTTNLNGCTFAVGPANAHHVRRVSHVNNGGNTVLQRGQVQTEHGTGPNLAGLTLLEPAMYRRLNPALSMQATVFGIRTGVQWRFYFQSFSAHIGATYRYRMYGVIPIL
ncbi:MAG TPA: hypothetical protein VKE74_25440 [Gemmataceae bacterium]|nr:hypothetical protein [Gemmataceae bacterium]